MNSFHKKRKYRITKKRRYVPTEVEKERMILVNKLYREYGTLDKVGSLLRLTRERVRQLLKKGERYHLFVYELTRDKKFSELLVRIDGKQLRDLVRSTKNQFDICASLEIDINALQKLIKYYNIDLESYKQDARYRKYVIRYSEIVKELGYHPSTTVMQRSKKWRSVWAGIDRLWGNFDRFRNELGIERPKFAMHPNTIAAWNLAKQKRMDGKKEKVAEVYKVIEENGLISCRKISEITGFRIQNVYLYLSNMIDDRKIKKVGKGKNVKYKIISF